MAISSTREKLRKKYSVSTEEKDELQKSQQNQQAQTVSIDPNSTRGKLREKYNSRYSKIDDSFVSKFFADAQSYLNDAQSNYEGMDSENRASVYDAQHKQAEDLRSRSWDIRQYLNKNKSSMKEEDYTSLISSLDEFDKASSSIIYGFYRAKEYDPYAKYTSMSSDEIKTMMNDQAMSQEDKGIVHELLLSNMPYNREYAEQDGRDMGLYDQVEQKRKYISDKYGIQFTESSYENSLSHKNAHKFRQHSSKRRQFKKNQTRIHRPFRRKIFRLHRSAIRIRHNKENRFGWYFLFNLV